MFDPENPPELFTSGWINSGEPLSLARLRGRVVVLVAFQMLCPACVEHALPQAKRLRAKFSSSEVAIVGLHSVFEHHRVMTPAALDVFVREFKLPFPVAIDEADGEGMPRSMAAYQMQGTPTLLLFDRAGRLRRHYFGQPDDILLAAEIMALAIEEGNSPRNEAAVIERKLAATLNSEPSGHGHDHHDHGHHEHGDECGCGHDHHHHDDGHDHRQEQSHQPERRSTIDRERADEIARRLAGAERMTDPRGIKPGT
ncbi:MAG: peroxiredoxin family protein [Hyphomicrobiaceae bacterium]